MTSGQDGRVARRRIDVVKVKICVVIVAPLLLGFGLVAKRLFEIQLHDQSVYVDRMARQYEQTFYKTNTLRGEIYDRNGVELVTSVLTTSVYVNTSKIGDKAAFAAAMARCMQSTPADVLKAVDGASTKGFFLFRKLQNQQVRSEFVKLKKQNVKGISEAFDLVEEGKRYYPYKMLASHLIGFANDDNEGIEGIECYFDSRMRATIEKASFRTDETQIFRRGRLVSEGNGIELTIEKDIQNIAEEELAKGVEKTRAKSGFAIVMDPTTGELLAMASSPSFDPARYGEFSAEERKNRAVVDVYEPGSVLKVFLQAAAVEERLFTPQSRIFCENGAYRVHDRVFKEAHRKAYGSLTFAEVLKLSSNIGSAKIGEKLGKKRLYDYYTNFGFGRKTGLGIPGESRGVMPGVKELTPVRLATVSFGQGISVNPVQVATAFGAVVNGGFLLKPYVVRRITNDDGATVETNQKEIVRRVVNETTSRTMREILREVVADGTGKSAEIDGVKVIGKTGTAQKAGRHGGYSEQNYLASFIGAFPMESPRYVIYIGVDSPQGIAYGGYVAAPIFREIGRRIVTMRGDERRIMQQESAGKVLKAPEIAAAPCSTQPAAKAPAVAATASGGPDFKGLTLREAVRVANLKGIPIEAAGSGVAYAQSPEPSAWQDGKKIVVYFR